MSGYGWIISRDFLCEFYGDDDSDVGRAGPSGLSGEIERALRAFAHHTAISPGSPLARSADFTRFRMYDDDSELYYEGTLWDPTDCHDMAPLYDFGMPNAGCTRIDIFRKGAWIRV